MGESMRGHGPLADDAGSGATASGATRVADLGQYLGFSVQGHMLTAMAAVPVAGPVRRRVLHTQS